MKMSEMLAALAAGEKIQQQDQSTQEPGPWKYVSPYGCMLVISRVAAAWGGTLAPNDYLSVDLPMYRRTPPPDKVVYRCCNKGYRSGRPTWWWQDYNMKQDDCKEQEQFKLTYDGESGKLKKVELA